MDWYGGQGVLQKIHESVTALPEALARVARFVVEHPDRAVRLSVGELAAATGSGEASIVRFCRQAGFAGFRDFKLALASDLAYANRNDAYAATSAGALAGRVASSLKTTSEILDADDLVLVARRLAAARHIDIFGSGLSGHVAEIFAYRFSRVGLVARAFADPVVMREILGGLDRHSVALAISETGLTEHVEDFLVGAKAKGAYTVAISGRMMSPLGEIAERVLIAQPLLPPPRRGEATATIAKIFLCELLAAEVQKILAARETVPA